MFIQGVGHSITYLIVHLVPGNVRVQGDISTLQKHPKCLDCETGANGFLGNNVTWMPDDRKPFAFIC